MDIKTVPYADLLKQELPALARKVIDIVAIHDPELLKINEVYDLLLAQKPNIDLLKRPFAAHPLTEKIVSARQNCFHKAQAVVSKMGFLMKGDASNRTDQVLNANVLIKQHLHRLDLCKNEELVLESITDFFNDIDCDEAIEITFAELKFVDEIDKLRSAHSVLSDLLMKRTKSKSERPTQSTREMAAPIIKAMKNLIKQIEVAQLKHTELDYAPLINELNRTILELKYKISSRKLHNKRKAEALKENESTNESTNPVMVPTRMMTNLNVEPETEIGFEKGFEEKLDQKKTVASSSKHLQPPLDKEEA